MTVSAAAIAAVAVIVSAGPGFTETGANDIPDTDTAVVEAYAVFTANIGNHPRGNRRGGVLTECLTDRRHGRPLFEEAADLWSAAFEIGRCLINTGSTNYRNRLSDRLWESAVASDEAARNRALVETLRLATFLETGGMVAW